MAFGAVNLDDVRFVKGMLIDVLLILTTGEKLLIGDARSDVAVVVSDRVDIVDEIVLVRDFDNLSRLVVLDDERRGGLSVGRLGGILAIVDDVGLASRLVEVSGGDVLEGGIDDSVHAPSFRDVVNQAGFLSRVIEGECLEFLRGAEDVGDLKSLSGNGH